MTDHQISGTAAGVPFVATPPATRTADTPVVYAWHLMDPPASPQAFAAAVPMTGVDAWRVYLGLPHTGSRAPSGGMEEVNAWGYEDAVMKLFAPQTFEGADEFPAVHAEFSDRFRLGRHAPVGLVGGSAGSAVAQLVMLETAPAAGIAVAAAAFVSPVASLHPLVEASGRRFNVEYPWRDETRPVERRLDFAARAADAVKAGQVPVRYVVGGVDDRDGITTPATELVANWRAAYDDPGLIDMVIVEGMGHEFATPPGIDPEPQSGHARAVDAAIASWLISHLH